ncbi:organic cation transporter protein-like isoform X1 [Tribolium castaneum]|uniref:organic cation transporter protein-like isoform X1 n=1 Tax=Tribolium castaneum TaxID=7070 RepID=UPI0030FE7FD5
MDESKELENTQEIDQFIEVKDDSNEDIIQRSIGSLGRWHIFMCVIISFVKLPVAWLQLSIVFIAPPVSFTCTDNRTAQCGANCTGHNFDRSVFTETIITEWDLVCNRAYLANLAQTLTMLGILFGNMLFGYLSDRLGRRSPLICAVFLQVLCGMGAAVSPWFPLFLVLRFIAALATGGTMVMSFVLVMEIVGMKWRTTLGILYQIPFNMGLLTLPLFAYFLRDWHHFHIAICVPGILLLSYYWLLPESPRWLLAVGRKSDAIEVLQLAARRNKRPTAPIPANVDTYMERRQLQGGAHSGDILDLVRTPTMRTYTACIGYNWFACGLCFFGGAQYIGQLGGNIFVNIALSAVMQIPSTFFSLWAVSAWGRKYTLVFSNVLSGLSCLLIGGIPPEPTWVRTVLSSVDMFALAISFPTVYLYSGELFPTVVRNAGVGTSSMFARVGSMAAPFVAGLVLVREWLPPLVFGLAPLIGALLCFKLPETVGCKLPDTVEEAEALGRKKVVE